MKDIFNRRQRFSLRKYSFGVASVLLGTALFAAHTAQADEVTAPDASSSNPGSSVEGESSSDLVETSTASTAQADPTAAVSSTDATASTFNLTPEASTDKAAAETTEKAATETAKPEAAKPASEAAKPTEKATSEAAKPTAAASTAAASNNVETTASATAASNASTTAANRSAATAAPVAEETAAAETAVESTSVRPNVTARAFAANTAADRSATLDRAATDMTNAGALATSRSRRNRRAVTDHNYEAVSVATTLNPKTEATPDMSDPNGATVRSQNIRAGYEAASGDKYTYGIIDLTRYNTRYNKNYYIRVSKDFNQNVASVVELVDKNTNTVLETHNVTAGSSRQLFTKTAEGSRTAAASGGELTLYVDYDAGKGKGSGKTDKPFLQFDWKIDPTIESYQHKAGKTPEEVALKKLFTDVTDSRVITDIFNAVEPAYNGREITNTNRVIPVMVDNSTFYKAVDENSADYKAAKDKSEADRKNPSIQNYKETGNEESLASYTATGMEGQEFTSSGLRHFKGYRLYQPAELNGTSGYLSRHFKVGDKFMDADAYGIKRIKEVVKEDGTVVIRVYLLDPKQQNKRSDGSLDTNGYMLIAETEPIAPGQKNTKPLVKQMNPLNTIAFTDSNGVYHPNGKTVDFDFQKAAGYTP